MNKITELKDKTLILAQTVKNDYIYKEWKSNEFNAKIIMKRVPKILRAIRKIWVQFNLPFESLWYDDWKKNIDKYETVIIHATPLTLNLPKWIKDVNNNIRVILWYWNPVNEKIIPSYVDDEYCEKWSFDKNDCEKYNMKYNSQYYFKTKELPDYKEENDVFFIGLDKGRAKKIEEIFGFCRSNNIKTDFNVVTNNNKISNEIISDKLEYSEILSRISKSKAILEILQNGQNSPTLRTYESLFFSKKLITNNNNIKEFEFYNENNIFILNDKIKKEEILEFLRKPYKKVDDKIINKYEVHSWLKRFFEF